jgi:hypothetical protein
MAALTAGYWHTNYWPESYWQTDNQYWLEFGLAVPEPEPEPEPEVIPPRAGSIFSMTVEQIRKWLNSLPWAFRTPIEEEEEEFFDFIEDDEEVMFLL